MTAISGSGEPHVVAVLHLRHFEWAARAVILSACRLSVVSEVNILQRTFIIS